MKMAVFAAIVLTSFYTVIAMVVTVSALQRALLAGISMIVTGFALLMQIGDFTESA
jgi:hypothetical protein